MSVNTLPDAAAMMASLLSLMTKFSCLGCPQQAVLIQRELALLRRYPDDEIPPLLKRVAQRLEGEWQQLHFAISDDPMPHGSSQAALH